MRQTSHPTSCRRSRSTALAAGTLAVLMCTHVPAQTQEVTCPAAGARLEIVTAPPPDSGTFNVFLAGTLVEPSCAAAGRPLDPGYARSVRCDAAAGDSCRTVVDGLAPGVWVHRIFVNSNAQLQARRGLALDASAGTQRIEWSLFQSVFTVRTNNDGPSCSGCLREAITQAEAAPKPALIQFTPSLAGTIRLSSGLPQLGAGAITIDGLDGDGLPHTRTIDVNGLNRAALAIRSAGNIVIGLRITNVGGGSDAMVIEGVGADDNRLEQLQIVGRGLRTCGPQNEGCLIDGFCRTPTTDPPLGACGDDGIAVRVSAGIGGVNVVSDCDISGSYDKGVKVSEFGSVRVERSLIHDNRDGGLQATFSGDLIASENIIENNQGTTSANGLAANGPLEGSTVPARVTSAGDIIRRNSLRGISVRSLSIADLRDGFSCGNGNLGSGRGFGLTVFDAAGLPAVAVASGMAAVYNAGGGARVEDMSRADFGGFLSRGRNAFAFNGSLPGSRQVNLQNAAPFPLTAANNQWEHCGPKWSCDQARIAAGDLLRGTGAGPIAIAPTQPNHRREPPTIERVEPSFAEAGDIVRIYGSGFDAIDGTGPNASCDSLETLNTCSPLRGNCVLFDRQAADVVAVTPTMIAVRAPLTCVTPVTVEVRGRYSRGVGRGAFCLTGAPAVNTSDDLP